MKKLLLLVLLTVTLSSNQKMLIESKISILLHILALAEGTTISDAIAYGFESEYDLTFGYGAFVPKGTKVSEMTIKEIRVLRNRMIRSQKARKCLYLSTAMGKYGWTAENFELFVSRFPEVNDNTVFTREIQDMFAKKQIEVIGLDAFLNGRITLAHYQRNLSKKWASIPDPYTGKSRYNQPIGISNNRMRFILYQLKHS